MKKLVAMLLALMMCVGLFAGCANTTSDSSESPSSGTTGEGVSYTYRDYSEALGINWNSHTWETNADRAIMGYITTQMVTMMPLDTENGVYQWVYEMATSVTDVTADHQDDLTNYGVTLPEGTNPEDVTEGYVYEVTLNPDAAWQDGTPINADTYIYSMQQLLNPDMKNYRANLVYSGEGALAGANAYYNSGSPIYNPLVPAYGEGETPDYSYDLEQGIADGQVYINVTATNMTLYNDSLSNLNSMVGAGLDDQINALAEAADAYGYTLVTAENRETVETVVNTILSAGFGITDLTEQANYLKEALFYNDGSVSEELEFEGTVGLIKVDDYTLRYVTQAYIDLNNFMTFLGDGYLV